MVLLTPSATAEASVFKLLPFAIILAVPTTDTLSGLPPINELLYGIVNVCVDLETDVPLFG